MAGFHRVIETTRLSKIVRLCVASGGLLLRQGKPIDLASAGRLPCRESEFRQRPIADGTNTLLESIRWWKRCGHKPEPYRVDVSVQQSQGRIGQRRIALVV